MRRAARLGRRCGRRRTGVVARPDGGNWTSWSATPSFAAAWGEGGAWGGGGVSTSDRGGTDRVETSRGSLGQPAPLPAAARAQIWSRCGSRHARGAARARGARLAAPWDETNRGGGGRATQGRRGDAPGPRRAGCAPGARPALAPPSRRSRSGSGRAAARRQSQVRPAHSSDASDAEEAVRRSATREGPASRACARARGGTARALWRASSDYAQVIPRQATRFGEMGKGVTRGGTVRACAFLWSTPGDFGFPGRS